MSSHTGVDQPTIQQLLEIAEELIYNNKILTGELLYNAAKRELKLPRAELLDLIAWLFDQKMLVEGSKLTRSRVLSNPKRLEIYEYIKTKIVVTYSMIKRTLSSSDEATIQSSGQLIWHLQMLMKFDLIDRIPFKNYSLFVPKGLDSDMAICIFLLHDPLNRQIVQHVLENTTLRTTDIYKTLSEAREKIYYRLTNLISLGLLSTSEDQADAIQITPRKKPLLHEILTKFKETD